MSRAKYKALRAQLAKARHADRIQSLSLDTLLVAIGLPLALALLWARAQGWLS